MAYDRYSAQYKGLRCDSRCVRGCGCVCVGGRGPQVDVAFLVATAATRVRPQGQGFQGIVQVAEEMDVV